MLFLNGIHLHILMFDPCFGKIASLICISQNVLRDGTEAKATHQVFRQNHLTHKAVRQITELSEDEMGMARRPNVKAPP